MEVALVQPHNGPGKPPFVPMSLLRVAGELLSIGCEVRILDAQISSVQREDVAGCDAVGFTCMGSDAAKSCIEIAGNLRAEGVSAPFFWGGALPSMVPDLALEDPLIDIVVRGYAEGRMQYLLAMLKSGERGMLPECRQMQPGIGEPARPAPYHLLSTEAYHGEVGFPLQTSRGCPHCCKFCYLHAWAGGMHRQTKSEKSFRLFSIWSIKGIRSLP